MFDFRYCLIVPILYARGMANNGTQAKAKTMTTLAQPEDTVTRTVNGRVWSYCDCEGFWWLQENGKDTDTSIRRSDRNQNIWQLVKSEEVIEEFKTMKKAMQAGS